MREYTRVFEFSAGLRPDSNIPSNSNFLTRAHNVVLRDSRLKSYQDITNTITDPGGLVWPITIDWPFPQLISSSGDKYLGTRLGLYRLDSSFIPTLEVGVDLRDTIWTYADFGKYVVFTNGAMVFISDPTTNNIHPVIDSKLPPAGCITNFRGQLVGGRVDGYLGNQLVYGQIGYASMLLEKNAVSGNLLMPSSGNILALKTLGEFLVVYSTNGITIVHPYSDPIATYGVVKHYTFGIAGPGCVTGDEFLHIFIDEFGNLKTLNANGEISNLGYQEFMTRLVNGTIMMSYDASLGDTYISDSSVSYILTKKGLTEIHQRVTSLCSHNGELFGIYSSSGDEGFILVSDTQNFGNSSNKAIQSFDVMYSGASLSVGGYIKNLMTGTFGNPIVRTLNPKSLARVHLTGSQFRYCLCGIDRENLTLDSMTVSYKQVDKTFIRGAYVSQATS